MNLNLNTILQQHLVNNQFVMSERIKICNNFRSILECFTVFGRLVFFSSAIWIYVVVDTNAITSSMCKAHLQLCNQIGNKVWLFEFCDRNLCFYINLTVVPQDSSLPDWEPLSTRVCIRSCLITIIMIAVDITYCPLG